MLQGIEADIEQAIIGVIELQLTADNITGVRVDSITNGCADDEVTKPFVYVQCAPLEYVGANQNRWVGNGEVHIRTQHLTGKDRDAASLVALLASVGAALDFGNLIPQVVGHIQIRRLQGSWEFGDSDNGVILPFEVIQACG